MNGVTTRLQRLFRLALCGDVRQDAERIWDVGGIHAVVVRQIAPPESCPISMERQRNDNATSPRTDNVHVQLDHVVGPTLLPMAVSQQVVLQREDA